jgi:hypothetical protein
MNSSNWLGLLAPPSPRLPPALKGPDVSFRSSKAIAVLVCAGIALAWMEEGEAMFRDLVTVSVAGTGLVTVLLVVIRYCWRRGKKLQEP